MKTHGIFLNMMQLIYSPSAYHRKQFLLSQYAGIDVYFKKVEDKMQTYPQSPVSDKIILSDGSVQVCYKRQVRTSLFSGLIPDPYLYLSVSYAIINNTIVVFGVYLHNYTT